MVTPEQNRLLQALDGRLRELAPALLAVSGGVDSRLLAHLARSAGLDCHTVLFQGPHLSRSDTIQAALWLHRLGLPFTMQETNVLDLPEVQANTRERCYFCKRALFGQARESAGSRTLVDGTNADDAASFRPGLKALRELGVRSPFAELGITKAQIRSLAAAVRLDQPEQPSRACLLTRFAYGLAPNPDILERLALAEDQLAALGLKNFRLRIPEVDESVLQLDVSEKNRFVRRQKDVHAILVSFGFAPYTILWSENVSGLYDEK